jgi:hypothetical protein
MDRAVLLWKYFLTTIRRRTQTKYTCKKCKEMIVHLVVIVIHEDPYIAEFLDHYVGLGVDRIYLYDNSPSATMSVLCEHPKISYKHFPGKQKQLPAYFDYIQNKQNGLERADFVGFLDADEFLVLKRHSTIQEFLGEFSHVSAVVIPWRMFGTNGLVSYDPRPVVERFQVGEVETHSHFKGFVRPQEIQSMNNPHFVCTLRGTTNAQQTKMITNAEDHCEDSGDVAIINHYFTKSFQEFAKKRARGRADISQIRDMNEVFRH